MPTGKDVEHTTEDSPLRERLRRTHGRARVKVRSSKGVGRRLRYLIWSGWLWLLLQAAKATWRRILIMAALALVALFVFLTRPIEQEPAYGLDHEFAIESQEFLATITGATDTPFVQGNKIDILHNGDNFYPVMLAAIEQAKNSVTIEAYIYWEGQIGRQFADALAAKAVSGVPVKILLDAVGSSSIGDEILKTLEGSGCQVRWYRPVRWYTLNRFNNRTHRKSLMVDGRVGFTGGAGIADHWTGNAQDPSHWRDIQIRIEGPAVMALQAGFARNWLETTSELISGAAYYPEQTAAGPFAAQSVLSSPETGSSTVRILYYLSIVCARRSILIANPYFIPDERAIDILVEAKRRGVDVKVMVAGIYNDNNVARNNSTRLYGRLLEAGVEIYEYNRTMLHHKFMVCDGVWSTVGTTNFDNRSFGLNAENNVAVYDRAFASHWEQAFFNDIPDCDRIEFGEWQNRGFSTKVREFLFSFLRDQA
jgi:cardiolipin synthase